MLENQEFEGNPEFMFSDLVKEDLNAYDYQNSREEDEINQSYMSEKD
jgi:hypothetical protein